MDGRKGVGGPTPDDDNDGGGGGRTKTRSAGKRRSSVGFMDELSMKEEEEEKNQLIPADTKLTRLIHLSK